MRIEAIRPVPANPIASAGQQSTGKNFGEMLGNALAETGKLEQQAQDASSRLASGQLQDVAEATIAAEKAAIALQLTIQVRNKAVEAYQEVMRMQV